MKVYILFKRVFYGKDVFISAYASKTEAYKERNRRNTTTDCNGKVSTKWGDYYTKEMEVQ